MAELNITLDKNIALLRVFVVGSTPQPSPSAVLLGATIDEAGATYSWNSSNRLVSFRDGNGDTVYIPAFYGQVLSANISEDEKHTFSIDLEFPYGQIIGSNNMYSKELSVFYPYNINISTITYINKDVSTEESLDETKPFFNVSNLDPSRLYRIDIVTQTDSDIIAALNIYYADPTSVNLIALDKVINRKSKEHYWCYLTDYTINKANPDSTITLSFVDPSYKLSTSWNDLKIPESIFMNWAAAQTSVTTYLFDTKVLNAINNNNYPAVFDGWKLSGYLLAILWYAYLFPSSNLSSYTLSRSESDGLATYSLTSAGKTINILKIDIALESIEIPISNKYPDTDPLVSNGFYNEVPPFQYMSDTLNSLSDLIGFFWIFNRVHTYTDVASDCMLYVTSETYPLPETAPETSYNLTGKNTYGSDYNFDDSNLRNRVSVFGRPYGLNLQYGATVTVDESVGLFGYKNFVLESPLILSGDAAEGVAKNILNNYAFNIGTISVDMPYTELIQLNQPVTLDMEDKYSTNGHNVFVYSRDISMSRFKKSDMILQLGPKVERTIVNFGTPLNNLSDDTTSAALIDFVFEEDAAVSSGCIQLAKNSNLVTNIGAKAGFASIPVSSAIFVYKEFSKNYTTKVSAGESITFKGTYTGLDKKEHQLSSTHTYTSAGTYIVRAKLYIASLLPTTASVRLELLWEWKHGTNIYRGSKTTLYFDIPLNTSITFWYESSNPKDSGSMYYVPYDLSHDVKFCGKFKLESSGDYGLIEGGFLVIPLAPAGRDSSNVPFNGVTLSESNALSATSSWMLDNYTLEQVLNEIVQYMSEGFEISDDGTLITYGNIANVSGIDPTNSQSSIITSVKTALYLTLDDINNPNPQYDIQFTPFYDSELGRITYANLMLLVPFLKTTAVEGSESIYRLLPKTPMFLLHGKLPIDASDRIVLDYEASKDYIEYSDINFTKKYKVAYRDTNDHVNVGNGEFDAYSLTNVSGSFSGVIRYKSRFPFVLHIALHRGWTQFINNNNIIEYSDIKTASHFYYKQMIKASDNYSSVTIRPFTDLEGVVKICEDNYGTAQRMSLIMFADPFHMYSISNAINAPDTNVGVSGANPDRTKLTPYLIASKTDTTPNPHAIGTFINAYRDRYVINASTDIPKIADILIVDYNVKNFQ